MRRGFLVAAAFALAGTAGSAQAQRGDYYPAFCQGMAIDGDGNSMFLSGVFAYPQAAAPTDGTLREGTAASEFTREVERRSGKQLLDAVCHSRATAEETAAFAASTAQANGAGWKVETIDWRPRGARTAPTIAGTTPAPGASALPAEPSARQLAAERREAERAAETARLAAEERVNAEKLREMNAKALAAAAEQTRRIEAEKKESAERLARFQAEQQAYERAKADHAAQVRAAADARRQWEADVAACRAGDRSRCGAPATN